MVGVQVSAQDLFKPPMKIDIPGISHFLDTLLM